MNNTTIQQLLEDKSVFIFDFDGTLVDSMGMWGEVDQAMLKLHGLPIPDNFTEVFMFPLIPLSEEETAQFFLDYGCRGTVESILAEINALSQMQYEHHILPKAGARELVEALHARGAKVGMVTAATMARIAPCLARNGMADCFDMILTCDEAGVPKTDPAIYRMALSRLGADASDAVFFDDNLSALRTARTVGLSVVGVYDAHADATWGDMCAEADTTVRDFRDAM